jgi:hypothetical protein
MVATSARARALAGARLLAGPRNLATATRRAEPQAREARRGAAADLRDPGVGDRVRCRCRCCTSDDGGAPTRGGAADDLADVLHPAETAASEFLLAREPGARGSEMWCGASRTK